MAQLRAAGQPIVMLGQVHREMPFMLGAANVGAETFDLLLDHSRYDYDLFAPPNPALGTVDHAIGLHASSLVRDSGTLQIIGELGDSIVYSLLLRHQQNEPGGAHWPTLFRAQRAAGSTPSVAARPSPPACSAPPRCSSTRCSTCTAPAYCAAASTTIYRCSVRWAANGSSTRVDAGLLEGLLAAGAGPRLGAEDVAALETRRRAAQRVPLRVRLHRLARRRAHRRGSRQPEDTCRAGERMPGTGTAGRHGNARRVPAGAAFFLRGTQRLAGIGAPAVRHAWRGLHQPAVRRRPAAARGAAQSRALRQHHHDADHAGRGCVGWARGRARVVSGVGGQYNFVAMAHALPGARSILCVRSTRRKDGKLASNIVTGYGNTTIPRHLRDIAITEYGIADLRGRTDAECIAAMLDIADSRFQEELLAAAKRANKIDTGYRIPASRRQNTPERLEEAFTAQRRAGLFSEYPFGTDLTRGNRTRAGPALAQGSHGHALAGDEDDCAVTCHAWICRTSRISKDWDSASPATCARASWPISWCSH